MSEWLFDYGGYRQVAKIWTKKNNVYWAIGKSLPLKNRAELRFRSAAEAKKTLDHMEERLKVRGYLPFDESKGLPESIWKEPARHLEMEAHLKTNPEDESTYLVYADWLQANNNPRGELIALMASYNKQLENHSLRKKIDQYIIDHASELLGPLRAWMQTCDEHQIPAMEWRLGFIDKFMFARSDFDDWSVEFDNQSLPEIFVTLLNHPSCALLQKLHIREISFHFASYQDMIQAMKEVANLPLRHLNMVDFEYPENMNISWIELGNVSALWQSFPELESVTLQTGSMILN
jgi:uncharacterized protein (TIGR02996 family)